MCFDYGMARRKRYDVFVSYSHMDAATVKPLVQVLNIAKRRVFWDEIIEPGQEWNAEIETALAASDAVVIMWCCDSAASDWVTREIATARTLAKPLTPIRLCPYPLRGAVLDFQAINLSETLHHSCDCADKEAHAQAQARKRLDESQETLCRTMGAMPVSPMPPPMASSFAWRATVRILALVVGLTVVGYLTFKFNYWRIAVGTLSVALLVGILVFALILLSDRLKGLRERRVAKTISLIEDTLKSEAGSKRWRA